MSELSSAAGTPTDEGVRSEPVRVAPVASLFERALPYLVCTAILVVLSVWMNANVWLHGHVSTTIVSRQGDVAEQLWFLAWLPHALVHLQNPFFTTRVFAGSSGVNVLDNTSIFLPSLVLAPVTLVSGPVAAYNVGLLLAPVVTGLAMFALVRRLTASVPVSLIAAVLWAFCPFMVSNLEVGHFHLTALYFPPLVALLAVRLLRDRAAPRGVGLWLGALVVAQFFTGSEILALTGFACVVSVVVAALLAPKRTVRAARDVLACLAWACVVVVPLLAVPVAVELFGPGHVTGPIWGFESLGPPLAAYVRAPGAHDTIVGFAQAVGYYGHAGPPQEFVGLGLLVVALAVLASRWRDVRLWVLAATAVVLAALSLGLRPRFAFGARPSSNWGPWRLLYRLPILQQMTVNRFGVLVVFCLLVIAAIGGGALVDRARRAERGPTPAARAAIVGAGALLIAVPIIQTFSFPFVVTRQGGEPSWIHRYADGPRRARNLLVVPVEGAAALAWQAQEGFRFSLSSGYLVARAPGSTASQWAVPATGADATLRAMASWELQRAAASPVAELRALGVALRRRGVTDVALLGTRQWIAAVELTVATGRRPTRHGNVLAWTHLRGRIAPLVVTDAQVASCVRVAAATRLSNGATCIIDAARGGPAR